MGKRSYFRPGMSAEAGILPFWRGVVNLKKNWVVRLKRALLILLVLTVLLLSTGCGSGDPLLGTWMEPNSGVVMELTEDDKAIMSLNDASITMDFKREDPDVIIFLASADGSIPEQRMTYRLKEDKLVLTLDGIDTAFFRVK